MVSSLCLKALRVPMFSLISGTIKYSYAGGEFCPCFYYFFNCTGTISHPSANSSLPYSWQGTEETVPCHTLCYQWNQRVFSAENFSNILHGLRNRNPVQAQPNPLLQQVFLTDVHGITHCLGRRSNLVYFIFLQAKLRAAKQAKIRTTSITDNAGVQELHCSSHLCPVFPDEFLPNPVGQWWQTLHFPMSNIFFKAQFCVSAS